MKLKDKPLTAEQQEKLNIALMLESQEGHSEAIRASQNSLVGAVTALIQAGAK